MFQLLALASRKASDLTDEELTGAATAILGSKGDPQGLVSLFKVLRTAEPDAKVTELLATPSATSVIKHVVDAMHQRQEQNSESGFFCRCPNCSFPFVYEI